MTKLFATPGSIHIEKTAKADVGGLGFDKELNQHTTTVYGWKYLKEESPESTTIKSGITAFDVNHAMEASAPLRGRENPVHALFEETFIIPANATRKQANNIVRKMDQSFKNEMEDLGLVKTNKKRNSDIGTEFYIGSPQNLQQIIQDTWKKCFANAVNDTLNQKYNKQGKVEFLSTLRNSQPTTLKLIDESLKINNKVRGVLTCGYGKGRINLSIPFGTKAGKKYKIVLFFAHNIAATKNLAASHFTDSLGTDIENTFHQVMVHTGNEEQDHVDMLIRTYSSQSDEARIVFTNAVRSGLRSFFYINKDSAKEFIKVINDVCQSEGYDQGFLRIIDESQNFTGDKMSAKTAAVLEDLKGHQVAVTASENRRGDNDNENRIYNDDVDHFGEVACEVTVAQGIYEKTLCPIDFVGLGISRRLRRNNYVNDILNDIADNKVIRAKFLNTEGESEEQLRVRGRLLIAIITMVKAIRNHDRKHLFILSYTRKEAEDLVNTIIPELQEQGIIPKSFKPVRAFTQDERQGVIAKLRTYPGNYICVGTPWCITGMNVPSIDSIISISEIRSTINAVQLIGRGVRFVEGKKLIVFLPYDVNDDSVVDVSTMAQIYKDMKAQELSHRLGLADDGVEPEGALGVSKEPEEFEMHEDFQNESQRFDPIFRPAINMTNNRDEAEDDSKEISWDNLFMWVESDITEPFNPAIDYDMKKAVQACAKFSSLKDFIIKDKVHFDSIRLDKDLVVICLSKMEDIKKGPKTLQDVVELKFATVEQNQGPLTDLDVLYLNTIKEYIAGSEIGVNKQKEKWALNLMN